MSRASHFLILLTVSSLISTLALAGQNRRLIATNSRFTPFTKAIKQASHQLTPPNHRIEAGHRRMKQIRRILNAPKTAAQYENTSVFKLETTVDQPTRRLMAIDRTLAWSTFVDFRQTNAVGTLIEMITLSLDHLSPDEQMVFDSVFLNGQSIAEMARLTNSPIEIVDDLFLGMVPLFLFTTDDISSFQSNKNRHSLLDHPDLKIEGAVQD